MIRRLNKDEQIPYDLLLLADETIEAINRYIHNCDVFVLEKNNMAIAIYAVQVLSPDAVEIKNIAVHTYHQGRGIGKLLLKDATDRARADGFKQIIIGTADAAVGVLSFYQREGFDIFDIKRDFFLHNYPRLIFEDGVQLKHMIMLRKEL